MVFAHYLEQIYLCAKQIGQRSNILRTVYHKAFIFHMLIGLGENKSPCVFSSPEHKVLRVCAQGELF